MSDNTPPIKNILITSKILIFLNALDSKKKINPEIGTNSAPINIIPGMALALPNIFVNIHNARKVIPKAKNTRENTQGLPHSSETSLICGVVRFVPAINTSSASSLV